MKMQKQSHICLVPVPDQGESKCNIISLLASKAWPDLVETMFVLADPGWPALPGAQLQTGLAKTAGCQVAVTVLH